MEKMTVHRALAELKLIDSKIEKATEGIVPSGFRQGKGLVGGLWEEDKFKESAESKYDQVIALLARKVRIKSAIVRSNSRTPVTVGGVRMSVADAIANKAALALKKTFVETLRSKHRNATASVNKNNDLVKANLQKLLEMMFGKDNVKAGATDVESVSKPYLEANTVILVDPLGLEARIEKLEKEIMDFETDVDATLSESNAVTVIDADEAAELDEKSLVD